jgi:hypothetical protein
VSVNATGEVYVAGWTTEVTVWQDMLTARYTPEASRVWRVVRYGTANATDIARAAVALADGVVVAADSIAQSEPSKVVMVKYGSQPAPAGLTIVVTPIPVPSGQAFTVTATVAGTGPGPPTGLVTFREGLENLCLGVSLTPAGPDIASASCVVSSVPAANRIVIVSYSGDHATAPDTVSVNVVVADALPQQVPGLTPVWLALLTVLVTALGACTRRRSGR